MNLSNNSQRMIVAAITLVAVVALITASVATIADVEARKVIHQSNRAVVTQSDSQSQITTISPPGGGGGRGDP
jgi:hypothetical protein